MTAVGWMRATEQITIRSPERWTSGESCPWMSLEGRLARIWSNGSSSRSQGAAGLNRPANGSGSWAKSSGMSMGTDDIVSNRVSRFRPLPVSFYRRPAEIVARDLLGRYLIHEVEGERLTLRLVE